MKLSKITSGVLISLALLSSYSALAKVITVEIPVIEKEMVIDNAGTKHDMWTYGGTIPGPVVRVTEGDIVDFTLLNKKGNKQSHSMDFHAAIVDVLDEFEVVDIHLVIHDKGALTPVIKARMETVLLRASNNQKGTMY